MAQARSSVEVQISGMHCANCALGIEKHLRSIGLQNARVSIATESAFVDPTTEIPLSRVHAEIRSLGYAVTLGNATSPLITPGKHSASSPNSDNKANGPEETTAPRNLARFIDSGWAVAVAAIFTAPLMLHMFVEIAILHDPMLQAGCALVACAIGLARFVPAALGSLRARVPNMEVLICIGIFASLGYSFYGWTTGDPSSFAFFESAAMISSLVLIGGWLERRVSSHARSAITELTKLQPSFATLVKGELRESVPVAEITVGDIVAVNAGDQIPCDGIVVSGSCVTDESIATGESEPQTRAAGAAVVSGTVALQGSALIEVLKPESESFIASMVKLVRRAQSEKPPISRTADRIAAVFVPAILAISLLTLIGCISFGLPISEGITRAVAVLVVACPCALGLATPAAVMIGIGRAAKRNILFRSGASVEAFANIDAVAFDKTGTLTSRDVDVSVAVNDPRFTLAELQGLAKGLELYSSHPIGKQLVSQFSSVKAAVLTDVREEIGRGVHGIASDGAAVFIGRDPRHPGKTVIVRNDALAGTVDIKESLRVGARPVLKYFEDAGIPAIVVSGDTQQRCEALGLGPTVSVYGAQTPEQKQRTLKDLNKQVAFVGDGVNDAPVLASAAVGISLGDSSSVALNSADVVLIGKSLEPLRTAHQMAKATLATIRSNLFWAFSYNIVAIPVAMAGYLSPAWAALAMGFSDLLLILNSLRLQVKKFD